MIPKKIVLHHSLTKDQLLPDWGNIRHYHMVEKKWINIGYHFGIEKVYHKIKHMDEDCIGQEYEIFLGRMLNKKGAHCKSKGYNHFSLGICLIGNFDIVRPSNKQLFLAVRLVKSLLNTFSLTKEDVVGHREVANDGRTCPGSKFNMDYFRSLL